MIKNKRDAARVVAQTIDARTTEVRDALFDSGVKISPNASKDEIADSLVENLGFNKRLQRKLGALAMETNPQAFRGARAFRRQSGENGGNGDAKGQLIETGGELAGVLLANYLAGKQAEKNAELQAQYLEDKARADAANAELIKSQLALENIKMQSKAQLGPQGKLLVGVLLVAALGIGFYSYSQSKK